MKSILKTILLLACCINAEPALHFGGQKCDISSDPSLQKKIQAIDDSLYARWSKGEFTIPKIPDLCGCTCAGNIEHCCYDDAISITSAHDVGDKFWLFDYCGVMDSTATLSNKLSTGPAYTILVPKTVLWKMVKDFKKHARKKQKACLKNRKKNK
ncbi:hypothetical protein [Fibrobacter succinogenes]|uniref:hypothetical protein n=1 Tax=Fibrobacter succinogenes TaxID=833 RepID=UPI001565D03A|nr:hypothetical protein [Fibrobacter succinogenes]